MTARVLVVDDSGDRADIVAVLQAAGYSVTAAATFEQAADIVASDPPDVLVTELRLGAFNGLHLIIRTRAHKPNVVAIVHTAFPDRVLQAEARRLNADYLARPVDPSALTAIIAQRLGARPERRASNRRPPPENFVIEFFGAHATLLDVSDGGFRVQIESDELPSPLRVGIPSLDRPVDATIVWAQRTPPKGVIVCGAELSGVESLRSWVQVLKEPPPASP